MTCYQRHLGWLFDAVGLPYERQHRREVHEAVVRMLGIPADTQCPKVWAELKASYGIDTKTASSELVADLSREIGATR